MTDITSFSSSSSSSSSYIHPVDLFEAAENGDVAGIRALAEEGADLNECHGVNRITPLQKAVWNGHEGAIKTLVELGADIHAPPRQKIVCLAARKGFSSILSTLADLGADLNAPDEENDVPIVIAAMYGNVDAVRVLVDEHNISVHSRSGDGLIALNAAAEQGHVEVMKFLIDRGADLNNPDDESFQPMYLAAMNGHLNTVKILAASGADIHSAHENGTTALNVAAACGHIGIVKLLYEHGADLNRANSGGGSPLKLASWRGRDKTVRVLVELGAEVNTSSANNVSEILFDVIERGHSNMIKTLVDLGADVNIVDDEGYTPLLMAAQSGDLQSVNALLTLGADFNFRFRDGASPLHAAAQMNHVRIVTTLAEFGADVNVGMHETDAVAIYVAARKGYVDMVHALVELGADIDMPLKVGETALYIACMGDHVAISDYLIEMGANLTFCLSKCPLMKTSRIGDVIDQHCNEAGLEIAGNSLNMGNEGVLSWFSFSKLLASIVARNSANGGMIPFSEQATHENMLATIVGEVVSEAAAERIHDVSYRLKCKLGRVAVSALSLETMASSVLSEPKRIQRFVELASFFMDLSSVKDVMNLRLTCKSNSDRMRFPAHVKGGGYVELEGSLVEEWLGYYACRFVSSNVIHAVLCLHSQHNSY